MKNLVLTAILLCSTALCAQTLPTITMMGQQSEACQDAALKALYIEARVGVVLEHHVFVYCTVDGYKAAIAKLGTQYDSAPDGVSLLKARNTYLNAVSVLRTSGDRRHQGDFLVAHEIGHFAVDSPLEWRADAWAYDALKKYVKVSYEDWKKQTLAKK